MNNFKLLLTTPDYPPQIGGLSTFCTNIERSLQRTQISYELLHWSSAKDFKNVNFRDYRKVIHVHPWGSVYASYYGRHHTNYLNFYHGSEILFRGRDLMRTMAKKIIRPYALRVFQKADRNIFISEFTMNKLKQQGFKPDFSRDLIVHNSIDLRDAHFIEKSVEGHLALVAIGRDVPHKNLDGCVSFAELIKETHPELEITLYITSDRFKSNNIKIEPITNISDAEREQIYQKCHFNLLLSCDHSDRGYFEGFGLTCLEAGKYGVPSIVFDSGGLPENVHDGITGIVLNQDFSQSIKKISEYLCDEREYGHLRNDTFSHTHMSHGVDQIDRLWRIVA